MPDTGSKPGSTQFGSLARRLRDAVLDSTVFWSFDESGLRRHAQSFRPEDLEVDLTGRVCVITGAATGIGRATAQALAAMGAEVHLAVRSLEQGLPVAESLRSETGNERILVDPVDVSDLDSVRAFADRLDVPRIDVLVHNAGVLLDQRLESPQGHELTFATHVLGPFLMTALLVPRMGGAHGGRVIWVSSGGMYARRLDLSDLEWTQRPFDGVVTYAVTKRAQVVLSELWAERLAKEGIVVHAMHPGWADTPGVKDSLPRFQAFMKRRLRTAEEGADTVVWLAASREAGESTGRFWFDRVARKTHWLPETTESEADRRALWRLCVERTGFGG